MKSITIVTALWGRDELTRIVLNYYQQVRYELINAGHEVVLLCVGSVGDHSRQIAESCGWNYIEHKNAPLSQKFNALFQAAEIYNTDLLMLVGSDDLVSLPVIRWYMSHVPATHPHLVGLKDLYFYSVTENRNIHFPGYGMIHPKTIGAGRCFSRRILQQLHYMPWGKEVLNRGLDSASTARMKRLGIYEQAHTMQELGGIAVDIKDSEISLTPFERLKIKATAAPVSILEDAFPDQMEQVKVLPKSPIFEPYKMYRFKMLNPKHPLYGKHIEYSGKVAQNLLIQKLIEPA